MNKDILAVIATLFIIGVGYVVYTFYPPPGMTIGGNGCTREAKICPDGSAVGRVGPNCEFVACPSTAGMGTIQGRVTLSPTCPVETVPPDPACAPKPYSTIVNVQTLSGGLVASIPTDTNGFYSVKVKPGTYNVDASGGNPLPSCEVVRVTVLSDDIQEMDLSTNISCDTGIR